MKKNLRVSLLILTCCLPGGLSAQPWSGILSPSRAINWSNAGVVGGIPSGSWPNCTSAQAGTTVPIPAYGTSGSPASASTINNALNACATANPSGSVLQLAAGTFYLNSGITFWTTGSAPPGNVALRGQGANQTHLIFSGGGGGLISMQYDTSGADYEENVCDWTAGYSPGTTTITLSNCGSTTPAKGQLSNLHVGSLLVLDQVDPAKDTGQIWTCGGQDTASAACAGSGNGGLIRTDGTSVNSITDRGQGQIVRVTGITTTGTSSASVTISPGLYMPNWSSTQAPQAWYANGVNSNIGVEDLALDSGGVNVSEHNIQIWGCYNCWVKGVTSAYADRSHINVYTSAHVSIVNSYFYQNLSHATISYGIELDYASDSLFQNNIIQQVTDGSPNNNAPSEGNVAAYNFSPYTIFSSSGWFQGSFYQHTAGDAFNLFEGNISNGYNADSIHGTHHFATWFRNYLTGWQDTCDAGASSCTAQTVPINIASGSRYFNLIANLFGTPGYHNQYQCEALSTANCSNAVTSIYSIGYTGNAGLASSNINGYCTSPSCTATSYYDPQTVNYLMRWGNWDAVNRAVQWNSSEVPSSVNPYGNSVPTTCTSSSLTTCPPSFYLSSKPSWWGSLPWPGIGPDITGGNLGQCAGGTYNLVSTVSGECAGGTFSASALGGLANINPAMNCALNVMGMPPDGSGGLLTFNESTCYGSSGSGGGGSGTGTPPTAPTPSNVVVVK